jgi:pimeloyl-ACP methyl ester carboxylesterase
MSDLPGTVKEPKALSDASSTLQRPVILINGMGSNFDSLWRRNGWVDKLQAAGRTVIGVDLPGHGASKDAVGRDAADLILDEAAKHGSVDAIGFSAGAWALLLAASERQDLFERIAVLGAADAVLTGGMHTEAMNQPLIDGLRSAEPTDNPMLTLLRGVIADAGNDPEAVAGYLASSKRFVTVEGLSLITADALVIDGSADGAGQSELVAKAIPEAERVTIEGADHFDIPSITQCALGEQRHRVISEQPGHAATTFRIWHRHRGHRHNRFTDDTKRRPTRRQYLQIRAAAQQGGRQRRNLIEQMFTVVQHQQQMAARQRVDQRLQGIPRVLTGYTQRSQDGLGQQCWIRQFCEFDEPHTVRIGAPAVPCHPLCHACLADSTDTGQSD